MLKIGSKPALRVFKLPFPGKRMVQDTGAQSVRTSADIPLSLCLAEVQTRQTESVVEGEKLRVLELGCGCGIIFIMLCIGRNLRDRGSSYHLYQYSRLEDIRNQVLRTSLDINPVSGLNEFRLDSSPDLRLIRIYQLVHIHKKLRN